MQRYLLSTFHHTLPKQKVSARRIVMIYNTNIWLTILPPRDWWLLGGRRCWTQSAAISPIWIVSSTQLHILSSLLESSRAPFPYNQPINIFYNCLRGILASIMKKFWSHTAPPQLPDPISHTWSHENFPVYTVVSVHMFQHTFLISFSLNYSNISMSLKTHEYHSLLFIIP